MSEPLDPESFRDLSFLISARLLRNTDFCQADFFMVRDRTYFVPSGSGQAFAVERILPGSLFYGSGPGVFGAIHDTQPKGTMFKPVGGKNLQFFSSQKIICRFQLFFQDLSINIVKIRCSPTPI